MARTSEQEVIDILGLNYVAGKSPSVLAFIRTANILVNRVLACATEKGFTIDDATLLEMETYLAAHYYGHADQFMTEKRTEHAMAKFQGQTGKGLDSSFYGQTAKSMDPSGCLASFSNAASIDLVWLGTRQSDITSDQLPENQIDQIGFW